MNERVVLLRDSVVIITQMLSGKGVSVTQRGVTAYVKADKAGKPIEVNLPYLPDNATEELCFAIQGFLDHEVAHILFSDFSVAGIASKEGIHSIVNILEDARIEKAMAAKFAGSGHNLAVTGKFFLDKYTTPTMTAAIKVGDANKLIGVLTVPLLRGMAGQFLFKEFMKDKMAAVDAIYSKIADMEERIAAASSSQDCLELGREIHKRISEGGGSEGGEPDGESDTKPKSDAKPKSKKEKKSEAKPENEEGEADGEESDSEEKDKPEEKDKKSAGADEEGDGGETGDSETGEEGDGEKGKDSKSDEDNEGEGGDSDADSENKSAKVPKDRKADAEGTAMLAAIDKESANGYDATLSGLISAAAKESAKSAKYLVYTKEHDRVEPLVVGPGYRPVMFTTMADKVEHMVGPLQKDLERAISARSLASWESGKRSGRISGANLSRLLVGDTRVFRRRLEANSKDVAVSLVVDASGSMNGGRIHMATQAAYALSSVLERIGITHEVICFTTGSRGALSRITDDEEEAIGRRFSRVESLHMPIIKGFNERLRANVKDRFGWLPNSNILANNVDGECVEIAARRLLARREAGKTMIVLSDGCPCAEGNYRDLYSHLKEVVTNVTKAGVDIVGIGIQSTEVANYYPKNITINSINELPGRVIAELKASLMK